MRFVNVGAEPGSCEFPKSGGETGEHLDGHDDHNLSSLPSLSTTRGTIGVEWSRAAVSREDRKEGRGRNLMS